MLGCCPQQMVASSGCQASQQNSKWSDKVHNMASAASPAAHCGRKHGGIWVACHWSLIPFFNHGICCRSFFAMHSGKGSSLIIHGVLTDSIFCVESSVTLVPLLNISIIAKKIERKPTFIYIYIHTYTVNSPQSPETELGAEREFVLKEKKKTNPLSTFVIMKHQVNLWDCIKNKNSLYVCSVSLCVFKTHL